MSRLERDLGENSDQITAEFRNWEEIGRQVLREELHELHNIIATEYSVWGPAGPGYYKRGQLGGKAEHYRFGGSELNSLVERVLRKNNPRRALLLRFSGIDGADNMELDVINQPEHSNIHICASRDHLVGAEGNEINFLTVSDWRDLNPLPNFTPYEKFSTSMGLVRHISLVFVHRTSDPRIFDPRPILPVKVA